MKDQELYDFFKAGSSSLDEMPSDALWSKIETNIKPKKANPFTRTIVKALLLFTAAALIVAVYYIYSEKYSEKKQLRPPLPVAKPPVKIDSLPETKKHDSLNKIQVKTFPKPIPTKCPEITAAELEHVENSPELVQQVVPEPTYKIVTANDEPETIAGTTTFKNRIVIRTAKPLTDAEFDLLKQKAMAQNEGSEGKMLIIIAPRRPVFRKIIPQKGKMGEIIQYEGKMPAKDVKKNSDVGTLDVLKVKNDTTALKTVNSQLKFTTEVVYTNVEVQPEFPGGIKKFYNYVSKNFATPDAFEGKGKLLVQFIIEKDGSLSDIKITKDIGFDSGKEAIRVLSNCPKWIPGKQAGKAVRTLYTLPITITATK